MKMVFLLELKEETIFIQLTHSRKLFTAKFEQASILYSGSNLENIIVATDKEITLVPAGHAMDGFSGEMEYFADCLINNQPPVKYTPESALDSIKICYQHINKK